MEYKIATIEDIAGVLTLHAKYHVDTILDKDKNDGFVTTPFTHKLLVELIQDETGLFIVKDQNQIVAYVMSASWQFCSKWPMFQYMISKLNKVKYKGVTLTIENSYQYGPICIDKDYRGTGVLETLFEYAMIEMSKRYSFLVTFVNKKNPRSVKAHVEKLGLDFLKDFEYNNNHYIELVCVTSKA